MNATPITVVAQIKAKPGNESQVRLLLLSVVAPSRKDAGCLNYDLHQGTNDPTLFLFHENWTSKAHLDAHLQKPICKPRWPGSDNWSLNPRRSRSGRRSSDFEWLCRRT